MSDTGKLPDQSPVSRHSRNRHRRCRTCGGDDEFLYEINGRPVYYCAGCDRQTGSGAELVGSDERLEEESGR